MPPAPQTDTPYQHESPLVSWKSRIWMIALIAGITICIVLAGMFVLWNRIGASETKVYHVGILDAADYFAPTIDGFKAKMTELGYVEGKNITYEIVKEPKPIGNSADIQKFVDEKVDLILAFPTDAAREAKAGTQGTSVPVVATEPGIEGNDLVESIQHPGGNLTAVRFPSPEIAAKRLQIMHQIAPKAERILVPYFKDYTTVAPAMNLVRPLAQELGVTLIEVPVTSPAELSAYLATKEKDPGFDAIVLIPEPVSVFPTYTGPLYAFADKHMLPVAGAAISDADTGPIFSLIPDSFTIGQLAAPLADKIFKGIPAGTLPVVTPQSVFKINYKVAQKLKLTISADLLSTADKVVH